MIPRRRAWQPTPVFLPGESSRTEETDGLQSMGSQRVEYDWATELHLAFPFSRGSSQPRDQFQVSRIAGGFFTSWATREAQEYWSGQPIPSPADLLDPGIDPGSPALHADSYQLSYQCPETNLGPCTTLQSWILHMTLIVLMNEADNKHFYRTFHD